MVINLVCCGVGIVIGLLIGANNAKLINGVKTVIKNLILKLKVVIKIISYISEVFKKAEIAVKTSDIVTTVKQTVEEVKTETTK